MPSGTPYNSFVKPYPIRVDEFSVPRDGCLTVAALHLLTHTHSDHIIGLDAKSFGSIVICSGDAKEMLLRHETYKARFLREEEYVYERQRTFGHLKASVHTSYESHTYGCTDFDLIRAIPLHVPAKVEISNNEWVTVTLIDANHCPGSVMYLIQGSKGAILHTGDFRAEPVFIGQLMKNPFLRRYIARGNSSQLNDSERRCATETLEAIYLDTASMLNTTTIPAKRDAVDGLIDLMKAYPAHMRFFINTWTWGYEDILKAVSRSFESKIHVDRYKHDVYSSLSDRELRELITQDFKSTRFHACERFARCDLVRNEDPGVVYINPANISTENWALYLSKTKNQLERGELPMLLLVPLHRHSTLPELQNFVSLFRPKRLVPNFLEPSLHCLDWACMPNMFGPYMGEGGAIRIQEEMSENLSLDKIKNIEIDVMIRDSTLENLEGGNASNELDTLAGIWVGVTGTIEGGLSTGRLINRIMGFLPKGVTMLVERALRDARQRTLPGYLESEEDDADSSNDESDSGRMAELLFGGHLDLPLESQSLDDVNEDDPPADMKPLRSDKDRSEAARMPFTPPSPATRTRRRPVDSAENVPCGSDAYKNGSIGDPSEVLKTITKVNDSTRPKPLTTSNGARRNPIVSCSRMADSSVLSNAPTEVSASSQQEDIDVAELASSSKTIQLEDTSSFVISSPVSFRTAKRHAPRDSLRMDHDHEHQTDKRLKREARLELSRRLSLACPDLANQKAPSQKPKKKLHKDGTHSSSSVSAEHGPQLEAASISRNESLGRASSDCGPSMDWQRSRSLEKQILEDLRMGRKPSLPSMKFVLNERFS